MILAVVTGPGESAGLGPEGGTVLLEPRAYVERRQLGQVTRPVLADAAALHAAYEDAVDQLEQHVAEGTRP